MEEVFVRDHDVSDVFTTYILRKEEDEKIKENLYKVLDILDWFRGTWGLSRYPALVKGKVVSPLEQYKKEDARAAIEKARFVFECVTPILKKKYGLEIAGENDQTNQPK